MIDRTMTEDAMLRHALTAYLRDELDAMILVQTTTTREYVGDQLCDEMGSRQTALEYSEQFLSWLTIALESRAHLDDGLCWDQDDEDDGPCAIHALLQELEFLGAREWHFDPNDFFAGKEFYLNPIERLPALPLGTTGDGRVIHVVDEVQHFMKAAKSGYGKSVIIRGQTTETGPAHPDNDPFFPADDHES